MTQLDAIRRVYAARDGGNLRERYAADTKAGGYYRRTIREALREALAGRAGIGELVIADLGCGFGDWIAELVAMGASPARVIGVDLLESRLRAHPAHGASLCCADCSRLPLADGNVDIALQFTALSSMPSREMRTRFAAEVRRILKPGGVLLSYDMAYGNPANPAVAAISTRELRRLFEGCEATARRITLAPPLVRMASPRLMRVLDKIPILRTHLFAVVRPAG